MLTIFGSPKISGSDKGQCNWNSNYNNDHSSDKKPTNKPTPPIISVMRTDHFLHYFFELDNLVLKPEKQVRNQISNQNYYNMLVFEMKKIKRVNFWSENITTCQFLNKRSALRKPLFGPFYSVKRRCFSFTFGAFLQSIVLNWKFLHCFKNWKKNTNTKCPILNQIFNNLSAFESIYFQTIGSWNDDVFYCLLKTRTRGNLSSGTFAQTWIQISELKFSVQ